jgi:hypothetical protein
MTKLRASATRETSARRRQDRTQLPQSGSEQGQRRLKKPFPGIAHNGLLFSRSHAQKAKHPAISSNAASGYRDMALRREEEMVAEQFAAWLREEFGMRDKKLGEVVLAWIWLKPQKSPTAAEICEFAGSVVRPGLTDTPATVYSPLPCDKVCLRWCYCCLPPACMVKPVPARFKER